MTSLRRRRPVDAATRNLRDAILDGRLSGGARLRQVELAERLGISRTPISEALGRLQHAGLIELRPRGGLRFTLLETPSRFEDASREHRAIFETIAVHDAEAAERLARAHIASAREVVLRSWTRSETDPAPRMADAAVQD